nr:hypothetical protein [Tanacetum cinerariifolium]
MRYVDTKSNKNELMHCIEKGPYNLIQLVTKAILAAGDEPSQPRRVREETYANTTPENWKLIDVEAEAIHIILNGIGDGIYSTVDACSTAKEIWLVIERSQQRESINKQDVKTKSFGNLLDVQFLQQLQPEWSRGQLLLLGLGNHVVQQSGIQCFNCKGFAHFSKKCIKQKRVKDYAYHKEKIMLCKQEEKGVPLSAKQGVWLDDTNKEPDEQELEAHHVHGKDLGGLNCRFRTYL